MTTKVELTLEIESGLTENAIKSMYRSQFQSELVEIDVTQMED